jgi:hypothetical protein
MVAMLGEIKLPLVAAPSPMCSCSRRHWFPMSPWLGVPAGLAVVAGHGQLGHCCL